jgi:hypothetical protein
LQKRFNLNLAQFTKIKYGVIWIQMDIDSTTWKISVKIRRFEQRSLVGKLVYYYIHVTNLPTKGFHSKRRSFTCIFQVVESISISQVF